MNKFKHNNLNKFVFDSFIPITQIQICETDLLRIQVGL